MASVLIPDLANSANTASTSVGIASPNSSWSASASQGNFRHRVHGEGFGEGLDIENFRRLWDLWFQCWPTEGVGKLRPGVQGRCQRGRVETENTVSTISFPER